MGLFAMTKRNDREGVYYIDGSFSGTRVRRSLDTRDRIVAKQRLLEFEAGVISGRIKLHQPIGSRKLKFTTVAKKFLISPRTGSSATTKKIVLKLCDYFGEMQIKFITEGDIDDYIEDVHLIKGNSNSTIRRHLNTLQSILNFAASRGDREYIKMAKPAEDPPKHQTLTEEEMDNIFEHLHVDVHRICIFLRYTGARPVEALGLRYDDIDFVESKVELRSIKGRSGRVRTRVIPLHPKAKAAIPTSTPMPVGHVFKLNGDVPTIASTLHQVHWRAARDKAYPGMTAGMYALRHTFATTLGRKGAPAKVIADLLGHTDLKMVMRYLNTTYEDHLKAVHMMA